MRSKPGLLLGIVGFAMLVDCGLARGQAAVSLPPGVKAVWDLEKAVGQTTPTRQRVCLNGLWRWQPAAADAKDVPQGKWGYFKAPGSWPGISDYMQKDCQAVFSHPDWKDQRLGGITAAWYERSITVPADWSGRRITLGLEYLNSYAAVFIDGKKAGEIRFPAGEVELGAHVRPGQTHTLSMLVVAMPLKAVMLAHRDTAVGKEVKGTVARRGVCGDVWLIGEPSAARIENVKIDTSVRKWEITFDAALQGLLADGPYTLKARISEGGKVVQEMAGKPFKAAELKDGRIAFSQAWKPEKLWDINTPGNQYEVELSLVDGGGRVVDAAWPVKFGFREFWIDGRDFYLNGTRIFLSSVPLDVAQIGAAWATYEGAREAIKRLQSFGINFVYTHNYGCEPGSHLSFAEILRAADDAGMLVALSQPHFAHYDWKAPDADTANGYAGHAKFYVRVAQNHASVIAYSMSHNATGYSEDMNPDMIDGKSNPRDQWAMNNSKMALRAEAIVKSFDPGRIVYHHASGNLGSMHPMNYYANFIPIQEQSDWFEHWATEGVKPVFTCEYAVPFTWDWTLYRGWYQGKREFGSAAVPWEFCIAEWNSQFVGDRAFAISEPEKANLRWEAKKFRAGATWHRWDYPSEVGSSRFVERFPIIAAYLTDNWRAFRTWGVSAISPWECGHYWKLRDGVDKGPKQLQTDWDKLQRPGFSPDFIKDRYERMDLAFEAADWVTTPAAQALLRNNGPLLAYIAGKPSAFTSKDHNFRGGETVEKQLVIINNSRAAVTCKYMWTFGPAQNVNGGKTAEIQTGQQMRVPLEFKLPATLAPGSYELKATFEFGGGEKQEDSFWIQVLPAPEPVQTGAKIAIFDPKGESTKLLGQLGVLCMPVDARASLSGFDVLIVGKAALTVDGPGPDLARVREGLKVILFEQSPDVLEKRLGFRVAQYGLRWVFKRVADHPLLAGINDEHLWNWRGAATLQPSRLQYELRPRYGPTVKWCDIPVPRAWRCGNRGNVASVLIEKPACGDFRPILDGGYSLQYSPLMEYREGKGMVLFCQMDVTGRTESDPAADALARNVVRYAQGWRPAAAKKVLYAGEPAGRKHLEAIGVAAGAYSGGKLSSDQALVVGPGGGRELAAHAGAIAEWLKGGGSLLAVGLEDKEANSFLPMKIATKQAEHIAASFDAPSSASPLAGVGSADVHNRDPRQVPLVTGGAKVVGNGVLAWGENGNVVFCQIAPWQFEPGKQHNLKQTFRRTSFLFNRIVANLAGPATTPLLERVAAPVAAAKPESRWLKGFYLDQPEEWDDPYRFFRW